MSCDVNVSGFSNDILSRLKTTEVYEWLDNPVLFLMCDTDNEELMYLVFWCDETENETGYLYLPVSSSRLRDLKHQHMTLHYVYTNPESVCYVVYINTDDGSLSRVVNVDYDDSSFNDFFPADGYFIEYTDSVS